MKEKNWIAAAGQVDTRVVWSWVNPNPATIWLENWNSLVYFSCFTDSFDVPGLQMWKAWYFPYSTYQQTSK